MYGSFATVAGMFALAYLVGQALVYAAEVAAVRYARLWPRALDLTRPTAADARALTLLAREQERIPAARVEFHLAAPGSPPGHQVVPRPPAMARDNAATPVCLSSPRCDCGDHPDLDYRQVSPRASADPRAMPMAAGVAAHETGVSLAAGDADGRPANDVNRQLKSYRGGRVPNGIRCQPARRPQGARSAVRLDDLACIVVVAQAAAPGPEGPDRRAPGGPGSGAVRRFGAGAQDRSGRLGCAPVPDPQPGPGGRRISPDAVVAPVPAGGHPRRRRAHRGLRRGQEPERPAGGGRCRGRGHRMGAGACGEGRCRPPPAV